MSKLLISLTPKYRLEIKMVKQRGVELTEPLLPNLKTLRSVRRGSKISRFFRHIFEHGWIKKHLGTNLAIIALAGSMLPTTSAFAFYENEMNVISISKVNLNTERVPGFPVMEIKINQYFHIFHSGVDFEGVTGDPVLAINKGKVVEASYSRYGYGNAVGIDHGNGLMSFYAHLSKIEVKVGQEVGTADKIGEIGTSGRAFGDHLHFEIRVNGKAVNPLLYLPELY